MNTVNKAKNAPMSAIPIVDFSPFANQNPTGRDQVALEIDAACRRAGFFYIINHGISPELVARAFTEARRFFNLPPDRKSAIAIDRSACHRGYFALGGENLDRATQDDGDFKEGIKIGRDLPRDHPLVVAGTPLHGPNQWPDDLAGWKETWDEYYAGMERLGRELMHAFALALGLPLQFFDDKLTAPMCTAGPLHYPPHTNQSSQRLGAGAHTDFGCLTILAQEEVAGLQVSDGVGGWIEAPCVPGSFVVNIGDMMARWTNDIYASTLHRVISAREGDRYSIPFFFDPDFDADVSCLATCQGPDNPPQYPPTTGGRYLLDRINDSFDYHAKDEAQKRGRQRATRVNPSPR